MNKNSEILSEILEVTYPFIIIFGIYIIANGHISPGGGFQGGAILSSVFICRYLVDSAENHAIDQMQIFEKLLYSLILLLFTIFLVAGLNMAFPSLNSFFLILMNFLIGAKVFCGLGIVFFRFVFYESR